MQDFSSSRISEIFFDLFPLESIQILSALTLLFIAWIFLANKKLFVPVVLILICGLQLAHQFAFNTHAEDSFIAYRYIQNFSAGNGLVFNFGEHVEGYSDFLWICLISFLHTIFKTDIPLTARITGTVLSLCCLVLTYRISKTITKNDSLSLLGCFVLSVSGCFACYGPSGMETSMFSLLILLSIQSLIHRKYLVSGILLALSTMTRPEGVILFLSILFFYFFSDRSFNKKWKLLFKLCIGFCVLIFCWTLWRLSYYHYVIPNAMSAKQGMNFFYQLYLGLYYLKDFLSLNVFLLILFLPLFFFRTKNEEQGSLLQFLKNFFSEQNITGLLLIMLLFHAVFITLVGGDWMPCSRFFAPILPLLVILLISFWSKAQTKFSFLTNKRVLLYFCIIGFFYMRESFSNEKMIPSVRTWNYSIEGLTEIGLWFHETLPPNTTVAAFPNGAFSYFNELPTIDVLGLTDEHIARKGKRARTGAQGHIATDDEYVNNRRPDIVAYMGGQGFQSGPCFRYYVPEYKMNYVPVAFEFPNRTAEDKFVHLLLLKEKKEQLIGYLSAKKNIKFLEESH